MIIVLLTFLFAQQKRKLLKLDFFSCACLIVSKTYNHWVLLNFSILNNIFIYFLKVNNLFLMLCEMF